MDGTSWDSTADRLDIMGFPCVAFDYLNNVDIETQSVKRPIKLTQKAWLDKLVLCSCLVIYMNPHGNIQTHFLHTNILEHSCMPTHHHLTAQYLKNVKRKQHPTIDIYFPHITPYNIIISHTK